MLSSACQLVKDILSCEDPRALDCILEAFLYMKQRGLDDAVDIIRRYISAMAGEIFVSKPSHPWKRIWYLLGKVESQRAEGLVDQAWKQTSAAFERNLGRFHETTLVCYLEYSRCLFHVITLSSVKVRNLTNFMLPLGRNLY